MRVHGLRAIGVEVKAEDQLRIRTHWLAALLIPKRRSSRSGSAGIIDSRKNGQSTIAMQRTRLYGDPLNDYPAAAKGAYASNVEQRL
jgi:hypothetical protein